jgi:hypothetical protein
VEKFICLVDLPAKQLLKTKQNRAVDLQIHQSTNGTGGKYNQPKILQG